MQAIRTKYLGPTNFKGSRVKAQCEDGNITVEWNHRVDDEENHRLACEALRKKLGWTMPTYPQMVGGCFDGDYYWVFAKGAYPDQYQPLASN